MRVAPFVRVIARVFSVTMLVPFRYMDASPEGKRTFIQVPITDTRFLRAPQVASARSRVRFVCEKDLRDSTMVFSPTITAGWISLLLLLLTVVHRTFCALHSTVERVNYFW